MVIEIVKFLEKSTGRSTLPYESNSLVPLAHTEEEIMDAVIGKKALYTKERLVTYALQASLKKGIDRRFVDGKWYYGAKSQYYKWPSRDRD